MEQVRHCGVFIFALLMACQAGVKTGGKANPNNSSSPPPLDLTGDAASCSLKSANDWQAFLEKTTTDDMLDRWTTTCEDSECDAEFYRSVDHNVHKVLNQCAGLIAKNPAIAKCTQNIRNFVPQWMHQHDAVSYGFLIGNHEYLTQQEAADKPKGMMTPPAEIVAALPDPEKVKAVARANGWKYLTHDSAITPNAVRTFIVIPDPDGRFDQWMLLNLGAKADSVDTDTPMSFIAVQKQDAQGKELPQIRVHFRDYNLAKGTDGTFSLSLPEDRNGKCYSCHPSGPRKLIDRHTKILDAMPVKGEPDYDPNAKAAPAEFAYKRLEELNDRIKSYGVPDWDGKILPETLGPALGADQGCTSCHDGRTRGFLTVGTSTAQLEQKVFNQLSMPPEEGANSLLERSELGKPPLSSAESTDLKDLQDKHDGIISDFEDSRGPALHDWLLETSCN